MVKILSQAGQSLADMYDVEGSIAGIDELLTRELPIVHEMGATIFSERLRIQVWNINTGPLPQNTNFDLGILNPSQAGMGRILGVVVVCNIAAQVATASVSIDRPLAGGATINECPIWIWGGDSYPTRLELDTSIVQRDVLLCAPGQCFIPNFVSGNRQGPWPMLHVMFRGRMAGFGAGTETIWFKTMIGFFQTDGVSEYGTPVPSW